MLVTNAIRNSASSGAPGNRHYRNWHNACVIYLTKLNVELRRVLYKDIL